MEPDCVVGAYWNHRTLSLITLFLQPTLLITYIQTLEEPGVEGSFDAKEKQHTLSATFRRYAVRKDFVVPVKDTHLALVSPRLFLIADPAIETSQFGLKPAGLEFGLDQED